MKSLYYTILILLLSDIFFVGKSENIGDQPNKRLTVYHQDANPEIFYTSDLTSIGFETDKDGQTYNVFGLSIDSVLAFPIESIDSVVFGSEDIIDVKKGAFELTEEILKYAEDYDGSILRFNAGIPSSIIPGINNLVYYLGSNDFFPAGLCAKVNDVTASDNFIELHIDDVEPSQIFNQLVLTSDIESNTSEIELDSVDDIETYEDEDDEDDEITEKSRATVWDGQHSYKFKGNVGLSTSHTKYDALSGDLISKITISVDGDFYFKSNNEIPKNCTYYSGNTIHVPLTASNTAKEWFSPTLDMKVKYKVNSKSSDAELKMKRSYDASFYVMIIKGDTIIYRPELDSRDGAEIAIGNQSFVDGSASLLVSMNLYIRPFLNNGGILATVTTGPTISGSTGLAQLEKMQVQYVDTAYENAALKLNTSLSVGGYITKYKNNKLIATYKMKKIGKTLKKSLDEGRYFLFPQFSSIEKTISSDSYFASFATATKTYSNMRIGVGVFDSSDDEKTIETKFGIGNFVANSSSTQSFSADIDLSDNFQDDYKVRPLIEFAGFQIKGPDGINLECPIDGKGHPHAIDLGLPSGLKWACCHVGATKPEEYGGAFQQFSDFHDDTWDDSWRLPTYPETKELVSSCSWCITTRNGVKGFLGTGPNGKTIFMPASGFIDDNGIMRWDVDDCMYMWTSAHSVNYGVFVRFLDPSEFDRYEYYLEAGYSGEMIVPGLWIVPDLNTETDYASFRLVKK